MGVALEGELTLHKEVTEFDRLHPIKHIGFMDSKICGTHIGFLTRDLGEALYSLGQCPICLYRWKHILIVKWAVMVFRITRIPTSIAFQVSRRDRGNMTKRS